MLSKVVEEFQFRVPTPPIMLDTGASHDVAPPNTRNDQAGELPMPRVPYGNRYRPGEVAVSTEAAEREATRMADGGIFGEPIPRRTIEAMEEWFPPSESARAMSEIWAGAPSAGPAVVHQQNVTGDETAYIGPTATTSSPMEVDDDEEEWEPHNLLGVPDSEPSTASYEPEPAHELPPRQPSSLQPPWDTVDFDSKDFAAGFHKGMEHAIAVLEERTRACIKVTGSRRSFRSVGGICQSVREIREEKRLSWAVNTLARKWRNKCRKTSMLSEDRDQPLDEDDLYDPDKYPYVEVVHIPEEVRMNQDGFSLSPHIRPNRIHHGQASSRYLEAYLTPLRLCDRIVHDEWTRYRMPGDASRHDYRPLYALDLCDRTGTLKEGINGGFDAYTMRFGVKPLLPDDEMIITNEIADFTYDQILKDRLVALKPPNWTTQYQEIIEKYTTPAFFCLLPNHISLLLPGQCFERQLHERAVVQLFTHALGT